VQLLEDFRHDLRLHEKALLATILKVLLLEEQEDDKREDFIPALLRLLYVNRDKGANVYLDALKKQGIDFD